jgi:HEAT repeat protein
MRELFIAAGEPKQSALIAEAATAGYQFKDSSLSDWVNGNRAPEQWSQQFRWLIGALKTRAATRGQQTLALHVFEELHIRMSGESAPAPGRTAGAGGAALRMQVTRWIDELGADQAAQMRRLPYLTGLDDVGRVDIEPFVRVHPFRQSNGGDPDLVRPVVPPAPIRQIGFGELLTDYRRIVLLGDPGRGKSWVLQMTALRLAKQAVNQLQDPDTEPHRVQIALPVRCADLAAAVHRADRRGNTLADIAIEAAVRDVPAPPEVVAWLSEHCRVQQTLFLLDAFEQIGEGDRIAITKLLDDAPLKYARIVVSSRISGYSRAVFLPAESVEAEIMPFTNREVAAVVNAWELDEQTRTSLVERLRHPSIGRMAQIPLLLAFMCHLASAHSALPETRAELYGRMLRRFLRGEHRQHERNVDDRLASDPVIRERELSRTLRALAFTLATNPDGWLDEIPSMVLEEYLADLPRPSGLSPAETLSALADHAGVLVPNCDPRDGQAQTYAFIHRTFAEYLTAEYLILNAPMRAYALANHLHLAPEWRETWLLAASHEPANVLGELADIDPDPLYTALSIAAEAIGDLPDTQRAIVRRPIERFTQTATWLMVSDGAHPTVRRIGVQALGQLRHAGAVELLGPALLNRQLEQEVRVAAARALGQLGDAAAVPYLRTTLLKSGGASINEAVCDALGGLDHIDAANALVDAINDSRWYEVKLDAADWLWRNRQFPVIVDEWRSMTPDSDPERHARLSATIAQVEKFWGDVDGCINFQRRKVLDEPTGYSPYVPIRAAPHSAGREQEEAVNTAIATLTTDAPRYDGTWGREGDIYTTQMPGVPGFVGDEPEPIDMAFRTSDGKEMDRQAAAELLASINDDRAVDPLIYALGDADVDVRATAAESLAQLRCVRAAPALIAAVFREIDFITRGCFISAVSLIDIHAVVATLERPFDGTDPLARAAMIELAFGGLRDRPVPIRHRRELIPALEAITALAASG